MEDAPSWSHGAYPQQLDLLLQESSAFFIGWPQHAGSFSVGALNVTVPHPFGLTEHS